MKLSRHDVWAHLAPMFHLVDVFAVYAITLVGGRHVTLPTFAAADALLLLGALPQLGRSPSRPGRPAMRALPLTPSPSPLPGTRCYG
jgi:hypothetical protein